MSIDTMILLAVSLTVILSALIYWSIGETRRHNARGPLRRKKKR